MGAEADTLVAEEVLQDQVLEQILENAHSEDIPLWAARIRKVIAKSGDISLVDLQRRSRLSLVDLWLALLLGDTGSIMQRDLVGVGDDEDFYRRDGILVVVVDQCTCPY